MMLNLRGLAFDDPCGTAHIELTPITFDIQPEAEHE